MKPTEVYKLLVTGIDSLDCGGEQAPCDLTVTGENAFPVLLSNGNQVLIAASEYCTGRIVVIAHDAYLNTPSWASFLQNIVNWLKPSPGALVGVHSRFDFLFNSLSNAGTTVQSTTQFSDSFGVFCTHAYDDEQASDLIQSLKNGNGLLIAGQGIDWTNENGPENLLFDFPGNKITGVAGIYFNGYSTQNGIFPISEEMPINPIISIHGRDFTMDINHLLDGMNKLQLLIEDFPSPLLVHGKLAFSLVVDKLQRTYLAAAFHGRGRVVVASHEQQLSSPELKQFILNAISWLDNGRQGTVAIEERLKNLHSILTEENVACELSNFNASASVYCCTAYNDKNADEIHKFVAEGRGLLIAGHAWFWKCNNKDKNVLTEFPGNKILNRFGITILGVPSLSTKYKALNSEMFLKHYHLRKALLDLRIAILYNREVEEPLLSWSEKLLSDYEIIKDVPYSESQVFSSIQGIILQMLQIKGIPKVSTAKQVKRQSVEYLLLKLASSIQSFVPDIKTWIKQAIVDPLQLPVESPVTLTVNATNTDGEAWRSTCLYISEAQTATITFPSAAVNSGLKVQIGCRYGDLSNHDWMKRPPQAIQRYDVNKPVVSITSIWGGLLYIIVPQGSNHGEITLIVEGASLAPYFKHGKTDIALWRSTLRKLPCPWAELASENIILTVPSELIRNLEDPNELLSVWAEVMVIIAELAIKPVPYARPERIVLDVQIKAGSMHAGYPIMGMDACYKAILDKDFMLNTGSWGPIHELGHNVDKGGWTLSGHTTEATCNLFTVYVHEKALKIQRQAAHPVLQPEERAKCIKNYLNSGPDLKNWHGSSCLETYLQLQEGFGWEPFIKLFTEYKRLGAISEDNKYRMNLWNELFSKTVEKNLTEFFKMWGWPIDDNISENLKQFPDWEENPMKTYIKEHDN